MLRRTATPGLLNMAGVLIVLALVLALALRAAGANPPAVAEFAPQAQQINQAPPEQTSIVGRGPNGAGTGAASPSPQPSPSLAAGAVISRCVGDPPRQIEDPQSPPCVAGWAGNNGGSTSGGVSGSSVSIAIPESPPTGSSTALTREQLDLQLFFNERFEFYGRKLSFFGASTQGNHADSPNVAAMRADADTVAAQEPFASADYPDNGGAEIVYYDELAGKHVISAADESAAREGEAYIDARAPYEWRLLPGVDIVERNLGEWICKSFAGRRAFRAGPGLNGMPRKFALLLSTYSDGFSPDTSPLTSTLTACGITPDVQQDRYSQPNDGGTAETAMAHFRANGDTSLICVCEAGDTWLVQMPAAESENYYPEWLTSSFGGGPDWDFNAQTFGHQDASEFANQMGLSFYNKSVATAQLPVVWAIHQVDPTDTIPDFTAHDMQKSYDGLLILASGVQMAGPRLTPFSFQSSLFRTAFPDPGAGGPPYYQARVGFASGHHHFFQDAAPIWWSTTDVSSWSGQGAWCWAAHGVRYELGSWPAQDAALSEGREPCY